MKFEQIILHKKEETGLWDLTLIGLKLEKAVKIMNEVLEHQKELFYVKEYNELEGKGRKEN